MRERVNAPDLARARNSFRELRPTCRFGPLLFTLREQHDADQVCTDRRRVTLIETLIVVALAVPRGHPRTALSVKTKPLPHMRFRLVRQRPEKRRMV